jgi:hypothetical protein
MAKFGPGNQAAVGNGAPKLRRTLSREFNARLDELGSSGKTTRYEIIDKLVQMALTGDVLAARLVFDRAEGKPPQAATITVRQREPVQPIDPNMSLAEMASLYARTLGSDEDGFSPNPDDDGISLQ